MCIRDSYQRADLHDRPVHGSDYPLPGINAATQTNELVEDGYFSDAEADYVDEVYGYNPPLFDLSVKLTVRSPDSENRFSPTAFQLPGALRKTTDALRVTTRPATSR